MSVCEHDPYCPGYGEEHIKAVSVKLSLPDLEKEAHQAKVYEAFKTFQPAPHRNELKDRRLAGKKRKKLRKQRRDDIRDLLKEKSDE